jgi:hypothetical protein
MTRGRSCRPTSRRRGRASRSFARSGTSPGITTADFSTGLNEEITTSFASAAGLRYFTPPGSGHVLWFNPALTVSGVTVQQFVTQMVTDAPGWSNVH